jgi:hypothetical protein
MPIDLVRVVASARGREVRSLDELTLQLQPALR